VHFEPTNLLIKTITRGIYDHIVEMSHLPTGITVRMEGRQAETSLPTLQSKARELLGRKVREALNARMIKEDQSELDTPNAT
jgi:hypothetical protein